MNYKTLIFEKESGIATITLNRPDTANTLDLVMARELSDVSIICDESDDIRVVIIRGAGDRFFSAGGDLASFAASGDKASHIIKDVASNMHMALSRLNRMDGATISAINGTAAGAGFSISIATDFSIAVDSAKFTMAYTAAGLSPDGGASYFLPRRIGDLRARELMMTNRTLRAQDALEWGLVNQVVAPEELDSVVTELAEKLANGPSRAYGQVKKLLASSYENGIETQMELETRGVSDMSKTYDGNEGIAAFLEKRKPAFKGS